MKNKPASVDSGNHCPDLDEPNEEKIVHGSNEEMTSKTSIMSALSMENFEPR